MKKNDWILLISVLCYSFLFYEQSAGVNVLLFNLVLIGGLFSKDRYVWQKRRARLPLIGSLVTAICVLIYGDDLSVFANICSLGLLASTFMNPDNSIIAAIFFFFYSCVSFPFFIIRDTVKRLKRQQKESSGKGGNSFVLYLIPVLVFLLFFLFYRSSSTLFANLTDQISFDFISIVWIFFTIGGFILVYIFYYQRQLNFMAAFDGKQQDRVERSGSGQVNILGFAIDLQAEQRSGIIMLVALNLLILVVNALDVQFLFLGSLLPEGMTYSELVHQGVGSLILSIITAIVIILWYFKGDLNFSENRLLHILAFVWIAQNLLMVGSNMYKNILYIEDSSLTYKRIGVCIYLVLATIGLIATAYKLRYRMSTWYLLKVNTIGVYMVLVASCLVGWDLVIVRYNIGQSARNRRELDVKYLSSLSVKVVPDLYKWTMTAGAGSVSPHMKMEMVNRMIRFLQKRTMVGWQSWNIDGERISSEINSLFKSDLIDELDLTSTLEFPYKTYIKTLYIHAGRGEEIRMNDLQGFSNLSILDVSNSGLTSIQGLPSFDHLKVLNLSGNHISVLNPVTRNPGLQELRVSSNSIERLPDLSNNRIRNFSALSALENLEYLDISYNSIPDYSFLNSLTHLRTLVQSDTRKERVDALRKNFPNLSILDKR